MAREHYPPAFTRDAEVLKYIKHLEERLAKLEKSTTATLQQISVADIDDPIEGEHVIDHTDDKHKWYSGGAWREAAAGEGDNAWPSIYNVPLFANWNAYGNLGGIWKPFVDAACIHNGYVSNSQLMSPEANWVNNATTTWHLRLGPKGSVWAVELMHTQGPDHGNLQFRIGSVSDDGSTPGGLQDTSTTNFITHPDTVQGYFASRRVNQYSDLMCLIKIMGNPGDPLTTIDAGHTIPQIDGGPGMYNIQLKINGNTAPSTGYRCGIQEICVRRFDEAGSW